MTVVFGVDFAMLSPDLAAALRVVDTPMARIADLADAPHPDACLIEVTAPVELQIVEALAGVAASDVEVVAIGGDSLEIAALDAGAIDFVVWPSLNQTLGGQLTATSRRIRRQREKRREFERLRRLDGLRLRVAEADLDLAGLAQLICDEIVASEDLRAMTKADGAVVELIDGEDLEYLAAAGTIFDYRGFRLPLANSFSKLVIDAREVMFSDDTENDARVNIEACRAVGIRSMAATPLVCDGKVVGTLKIASNAVGSFGSVDRRTLRSLGTMVSTVMQREMERERLRDDVAKRDREVETLRRESDSLRTLATTDPLTGLLNRRQFTAAADETLRRGAGRRPGLAVLMLDLDQFKSINDAHGHGAGDAVLVAVAGWLTAALRDGDLLGRIGGEEFAIVLPRVEKASALAAAERIRVAVESGVVPFRGEWLRTSVSIGVAMIEALTPQEDAFRRADSALYRAKTGGRNRIMLHEDAAVLSFPGAGSSAK